MKTLGAYYCANVSQVEDILAHLVEHCMVEYLYRQMTNSDKPFFNCDGATDESYIGLDIEVHDADAAEFVDKLIIGEKPDIPREAIGDQLRRIEIEEELPLRYDSLAAVITESNRVWHGLKWQFGETKSNSTATASKPSNKVVQYGLKVNCYRLRLDYLASEENMAIADMLAVKFLRDKNIYATSYRPDGKGATYEFKTLAKAQEDYLKNRLKDVEEYYLSEDLRREVQLNFSSNIEIPEIKFSLTML